MKKIAWGFTGAGHFLEDCLKLLLEMVHVDVYLSKAAEEVIQMYGFQKGFVSLSVYKDKAASSPQVGKFYQGEYDLLVIAPATSNSVAKFVNGISDSLISNLFAHAGKCCVPIIILPCDSEDFLVSRSPTGLVKVFPRQVDLTNLQKLKQMDNVVVASNPGELRQCLKNYL
ncbi:MAG: flavoprotein [Firmicutes bacterium]|nr:flavoprotein [Bacillota bacterium]